MVIVYELIASPEDGTGDSLTLNDVAVLRGTSALFVVCRQLHVLVHRNYNVIH